MAWNRQLLAYLRSFWRGVRRPSQLDADMNDEMRFHLDMEAQRFMQRGLDATEARRQAALAFGGVEKYRGAGRDALGFTWLRGLSVDFKLGLRMLRKYPGLTCVALLALSLAIGAGAAYLEFVNDLMHGKLPFPDGDRIVGIQNWDQQTGEPENRSTFDFVRWRGTLSSFEDIGARRALDRNLITDDGRAEPVRGVEISASAFRMVRVPPLLGRPLVPDDERPAAAPVVVLGYDLWTGRFGSDPAVIGRAVKLGNVSHTVVGVMPAGFGFPVSHSLWAPLRLGEADYPRREGSAIKIFGRLVSDADTRTAQAELTTIAERTAAEFPDTHQHLRPVVKTYVESVWSAIEDSRMQTIVLYAANVFFIGLLVVCGANIATLVFARTATREVEISVRTALGASRARVAGQLFAEALVLSTIAAALGLSFGVYALQWVNRTWTVAQGMRMMFWWNDRLSPETYLYAGVLAVVAALIVGVVPALKATGPRVQERLKHATGAAAGLKFGGVWTGVIVTQVGLTVVFLAIVGTLGWGLYFQNAGDRALTFPGAEYVVMRLNMDREASNASADAAEEDARFRMRLQTLYGEFARRLGAEPGVAGVTYAARLPGTNQLEMRAEVDGMASHSGPEGAPWVSTTPAAVGFFEAFQTPIVTGRSFTDADLAPGRQVAIVDQSFVRYVLAGQDAVGRRIRAAASEDRPAGPWMEIVGVAADLTVDTNKKASDAVVYRPATAEAAYPLRVAVRVSGDPSPMMWRLRVIAAEADPSLRLDELNTLDQVGAADRVAIEFFLRLLAGVGAVALLLATAGVYALMSFTVARRTTEIGIRIALGASARRVVATTFSRALAQVSLGVLIGSVPAAALVAALAPEVSVSATGSTAIVIGAMAAGIVIVVTALACYLPARRALRIQPTDALKTT